MWGCNLYRDLPFTGFLFSRGILSLIFWGLLILIIFLFIKSVTRTNKRPIKNTAADRHDSLEILKIRYAKGEISDEEFSKMKQILGVRST